MITLNNVEMDTCLLAIQKVKQLFMDQMAQDILVFVWLMTKLMVVKHISLLVALITLASLDSIQLLRPVLILIYTAQASPLDHMECLDHTDHMDHTIMVHLHVKIPG